MVNSEFIGQTTSRVNTSTKFRKQAKATFEAAKETGRDVLYEFSGDKSKVSQLTDKLYEYSKRYDVDVKIIFKE